MPIYRHAIWVSITRLFDQSDCKILISYLLQDNDYAYTTHKSELLEGLM